MISGHDQKLQHCEATEQGHAERPKAEECDGEYADQGDRSAESEDENKKKPGEMVGVPEPEVSRQRIAEL